MAADLVYLQGSSLSDSEELQRAQLDKLAEEHGFEFVLLPANMKVVGVVPGFQRPAKRGRKPKENDDA